MRAAPVTVWRVPVAASLRVLGNGRHWLNVAEQRRAGRLAESVRAHFVVGRAALRAVLAERLARPAAALVIVEAAGGRPRLADDALVFSVAHSGDLVLLAVADRGPLGVDVEAVRAVPAAATVAREVLGAAAAGQLERLPPAARSRAFLLAWTTVEARIKATGDGLGLGIAAAPATGNLHVTPLPLGPGHVGALASGTPGPPTLLALDPARLALVPARSAALECPS